MKNTLFLATYFNNPHFVELQVKSFKLFIQDEYDFCVLNDAAPDTKSLLSGQDAGEEIKRECEKHSVRHIGVPQSIHALKRDGGLVPQDNEFAGVHHPTVRHQALLRWIFDNNKTLGLDQYKTVILLDADMFFRKSVNISQYMEDHDMMGSWRELHVKQEHLDLNQSDEVKVMLGTTFKFYTLCLLFINMSKINNLETFDNNSFVRITDTGGKTKYFIEGNPQYKFGYLKDTNSQEYRVDFFSNTDPHNGNAEIIHYRGGSAWDHQSREYYLEKMHRMFKTFLPELHSESWNQHIDKDLTDRYGYHTFKKE